MTNGDGAPDAAQVKTWFDHKGFGNSNARNMANTYIMIAKKDVPEAPSSEPAAKSAPKKSSSTTKKAAPKPADRPPTPQVVVPTPTSQGQDGPSLHIDIQIHIHIPADADPGQIDQIFASMAKHLYPKRAGE